MAKREFKPEEVALIHRTMMDGASKDDVALFVATCERTGLDPFARQIMPSSRNTRKGSDWVATWTWLVTIYGLRKIAVDSGEYEGQEGPYYCGMDGVWKDIWLDSKPPAAAPPLSSSPKARRQEREILDALAASKGSHGEAAAMLGINRSTLYRRMKRLGLEY